MLSSKIMFILLALLIASFTFCNVNTKVKENFWGNRTIKPQLIQIEKIIDKSKNKVSFSETALRQDAASLLGKKSTAQIANNTMYQLSGGMVTLQPTMENYNKPYNNTQYIENYNKPNVNFYQVPNFQANLSPRESFSNNTFPGSSIKYNLPAQENTAYNNYVDMVQENYSKENGCSNKNTKPFLSALDINIPPGYVNGLDSYENAMGQKKSTFNPSSLSNFGSNLTSTLPISTMENISDSTSLDFGDIGKDVEEDVEKEIYNAVRYVFANTNSRIRSQGCPFRGDLFIPPCPQVMKSSYGITDLQQGAMAVMGGNNKDNDSQAAMTRVNYSMGLQHFGGETLSTSMLSELGAFTDVNIAMN